MSLFYFPFMVTPCRGKDVRLDKKRQTQAIITHVLQSLLSCMQRDSNQSRGILFKITFVCVCWCAYTSVCL